MIVRMADSTQPWLIPDTFRQRPNGVAAYADGDYRWPQRWYDSFPRRISIATTPNPQAVHARFCDVERGDFSPAMVPAFFDGRKQLLGEQADVGVYASRSTVAAVIEVMSDPSVTAWELLWWIATLDGRAWTARELADDLSANFGVLVQPAQIFANQWLPMGSYDISTVFRPPEWI